jgi:hypothetical protein
LSRIIARVGLSQVAIEWISYAALGLVVGLAGFIVLNELRTSGVLGRRRRPAPPAESVSGATGEGLSWQDVDRASLPQKPRVLLELIAARLTERSWLPRASGFTVRELARAARLPEESDRERLTELALTAERVRFSDDEISAGVIEAALVRGRELLERL